MTASEIMKHLIALRNKSEGADYLHLDEAIAHLRQHSEIKAETKAALDEILEFSQQFEDGE